MCSGELRVALRTVLDVLERGDWRRARRLLDEVPAGHADLVRWAGVLRVVAWSMELQLRGDLSGAWERLQLAASGLPPAWRISKKEKFFAKLEAPRIGRPPDEELARRISAVIWREQFELDDLRRRAACMPRGRAELIEAAIHYLLWAGFDPFVAWAAVDDPAVSRERGVFLKRATRLRQFGRPTSSQVAQSVWRRIGEFPGLYAAALEQLAGWPAPAPWCDDVGTEDVVLRRGRWWAWTIARGWRDDQR